MDAVERPPSLAGHAWLLRGVSEQDWNRAEGEKFSSGAFTTGELSVNLLSVRSVEKLVSLNLVAIAAIPISLCEELGLEIKHQPGVAAEPVSYDPEHYVILGTRQKQRGRRLRDEAWLAGRYAESGSAAREIYEALCSKCGVSPS
jgi:hypothetical protein